MPPIAWPGGQWADLPARHETAAALAVVGVVREHAKQRAFLDRRLGPQHGQQRCPCHPGRPAARRCPAGVAAAGHAHRTQAGQQQRAVHRVADP
ncbi:hypothetical protein RZS08_59005, partial [Arthrospira platensis SPKY1]|nr:hypothetical protein [Arthrospira platensis SPKY1]